MDMCNHTSLVLLSGEKEKLRCRHCHLTIEKIELGSGYCPECFETVGKKHYDFEPMAVSTQSVTRYRCEGCGVIIDCD